MNASLHVILLVNHRISSRIRVVWCQLFPGQPILGFLYGPWPLCPPPSSPRVHPTQSSYRTIRRKDSRAITGNYTALSVISSYHNWPEAKVILLTLVTTILQVSVGPEKTPVDRMETASHFSRLMSHTGFSIWIICGTTSLGVTQSMSMKSIKDTDRHTCIQVDASPKTLLHGTIRK